MLEVLDTAGQEEYTALRDQWIRDGEGFVLVYSITSRSSFSRIQRFYNQIQRVKESAGSPISIQSPTYPTPGAPSGPVPIMLVGNKCDKATDREVSAQEGRELARELNCDWLETSAKNCVNVEAAFFALVRALRRQRERQPERRGTGFNPGARGQDHLVNPDHGRLYRNTDKKKHGRNCVIL